MGFEPSPRAQELIAQVEEFIRTEIEPVEAEVHAAQRQAEDPWQPHPVIAELQAKARKQGLWNLFLPEAAELGYGEGLCNLDYAPIAELTGRSFLAPGIFNCSAPDTGNMEVLVKYGSAEQQREWLEPLLDGADPVRVLHDRAGRRVVRRHQHGGHRGRRGRRGRRQRPEVVEHRGRPPGLQDPDLHGSHRPGRAPVRAAHDGARPARRPRRQGRADAVGDGPVRRAARARRGVLRPRPRAGRERHRGPGPGVRDRAGTAGPGPGAPLHAADRAGRASLELAIRRGTARTAFGKPLVNLGGNRERIAEARIAINSARLLVLQTAHLLDTAGLAGALSEVSQIKVAVPRMAQDVVDFAIQLHGGGGLSDDHPLAGFWTAARALRLADGPDEVHRGVIAKLELAKYSQEQ